MAVFDAFLGPSYTPSSLAIECQRTVNWYREVIESGQGKKGARYGFLRAPGLKRFNNPGIGNLTARGMYSLNGHLYAVIGQSVREIFADGTSVEYGQVPDDGQPVGITSSTTQIMIVSQGNGFILKGGAPGDLVPIGTGGPGPDGFPSGATNGGFPQNSAAGCEFLDGYFIVFQRGTPFFQISQPNDGTAWDPADTSDKESRPDNIVAIKKLAEELWIFGSISVQVFVNSGNPNFPLSPRQDVVLQVGCYAPNSVTILDNSLFWIGGSERGQGIIWRTVGYGYSRVSNHAVENAMRTYARYDDAVGWTYEENGHIFYHLWFPTADASWRLDLSTGDWDEVASWDGAVYHAHRGSCAAAAFGKILIGDRANGKIYQQGMQFLDEDGTPIRRLRRCPHLVEEQKFVFYEEFQIDAAVGVGLVQGQGQSPMGMLRWSNDGGKTWSNEHWVDFGEQGQWRRRAIWRRLGKARDRVFEFVVTDPVDWSIAGCYMRSTLGLS